VLKRTKKSLLVSFSIIALTFFVVRGKINEVFAVEIGNVEILTEHLDINTPGFDICTELRHLREPGAGPTETSPYQVMMFGVQENTDDSGDDPDSEITQEGDILQKWFLDACVMDGYITEVRHVATIHNFDIRSEEKIFADQVGRDEANLGELFEQAFMEVTRANALKDEEERELAEASLKDFLLAFKDSHEQFMTDLMQAISEKEKLSLDRLKEYELAKIEKAREDVNKLTYEVYRELIEEPLIYDNKLTGNIIRSLGLTVVEKAAGSSAEKCPFGVMVYDGSGDKECVVIKKEGRVIQNVDNFIYEEALQKARDFIMCFFAPERHFPIGEDYYFAASSTEFQYIKDKTSDGKLRDGTDPNYIWSNIGDAVCGKEASDKIRQTDCVDECKKVENWESNNLEEIITCRTCIRKELDKECNTKRICDRAMAYADRKTPGGRPDIFSIDFEAYKKMLCPSDQIKEDIKRDMLYELARKYNFIYDAPPENWYYKNTKVCPLVFANLGYDVNGLVIKELDNPLRKNTLMEYQKYQEAVWGTELKIAIAYRPDVTDEDIMHQNESLTASTGYGLQSYVQNIVDKIISDYQTIRTSEYLAGEGLRSEKYLIGFPADDGDGNSLGYYFIDTENIISPALFLKEKVAAATQAQFDLAQQAFKQEPEGPFGSEETCPEPRANGGAETSLSDYNNIKSDPKLLEHGWYLVNQETDPSKEKDLICIFPQFNDITGTIFSEIKREPYIDISEINELPAPWEDYGEYMQIPEEYTDWFEGDINGISGESLGLKKAPPAFDIAEYGTQYPDLSASDAYPNIYGDAYGEDSGISMPVSEDYYTNKWYKGVTQLYNKPMSEILRTWFKQE